MTDQKPASEQQLDDQAVQILSNEGAQCGNCGDQPGDRACPDCERYRRGYVAALRAAGWMPRTEVDKLRTRVAELEGPAAETPIGSITIRSESVQLDNGECLRDLAIGDSVELRPETGHEGLWIAAAFHGDYQDQITLQYAEVVDDCGSDPVIACKFSGTRHAHPVDLDGKVRPRPGATTAGARR
jgi:hypothetical protein